MYIQQYYFVCISSEMLEGNLMYLGVQLQTAGEVLF